MVMRPTSVYCMTNVVYVPPEELQVTHQEITTAMTGQDCFSENSVAFMEKVLAHSGTSDSTHWPPAVLRAKDGVTKADMSMARSREEAEMVIFPIVQRALEESGLKPCAVDFLIVNCSLFTPTPSLCAMICHKFGLREDVRSYNLGGMGCSANVISVDLAKQLLQNAPGSRALVVSTEMITPNLYMGNEKGMLLQNTLFRVGGVALVLSSRRGDASHAKYELLHTVRVQVSDDRSYGCVFQKEDDEGYRGVALTKDVVPCAGRAMQKNLTRLARHVLSSRELARAALNMLHIAVATHAQKAGFTQFSVPESYVPDFTSGIDHFCIHAGGRAVLEGVQAKLGLSEEHMRPSKMTLYDWGNTSSSSIWYEAEHVERFGNLRKGDRILQVAFGSGFKCNTAVWRTLRVDPSKYGVPLKSQSL